MIQSGLFQGYVFGAIYRLIVRAYSGVQESDSFIKKMISVILMVYAISSLISAISFKHLSSRARVFVIMAASTLLSLITVVQWRLADQLDRVSIVAVIAGLFGCANICLNQLTSVYLSENFKGQLEAFLIFKQSQNIFCSLFMVAYIVLSNEQFLVSHAAVHVLLSAVLLLTFRGE